MTTPNFASILDEAPTEVIYPPPLPQGTYLCVVQQWEDGKSESGPFGQFRLKPIGAMDDVNDELLAECGGLEGKLLYRSFWDTNPEQLDEFHVHCGLDLSEPISRRTRNAEVVNSQILAYVQHFQNKQNPQRVQTRVTKTAPAE